VYINLKKESFKMKHLANFYQTWYNEFLLWREFMFIQNESPSPFQKGIITKVQK
jgi:hypothetical protein